MFTDEHRRTIWNRIRQQGIRAFESKLTADLFSNAAQSAGVLLGRGPLWLGNLVWLGIASAIHEARDFAWCPIRIAWQAGHFV